MPRKTELLNQELNNARELIEKGDSASASNMCRLIEVDAYICILDKLTEIEKHIAALAVPFQEAYKDGQPVDLENAAKAKPNVLGTKLKGS
jgi:hypothetical protein